MKTIKKASLLFASLALVLGAGLVGNSDTKEVKAADEVYKTLSFPDDNKANNNVGSYTDSWTAIIGEDNYQINNGNNNNWKDWTYIKFGRKKVASVGSIVTPVFNESVTKVVLTIDKLTVANIKTITLSSADSATAKTWDDLGTFSKATGSQTVEIESPLPSKSYKLTFDCSSGSSNGLIQISKVEFYKSGDIIVDDAQAIIDLITAIGDVSYTPECKKKIDDARSAYDNAPDLQSKVTNYSVLTAAEAKYAELKEEADMEVAMGVEDKIDALPTINDINDNSKVDDIYSVNKEYQDLSDDQKAFVNKDRLTKLEGLLEKLKEYPLSVEQAIAKAKQTGTTATDYEYYIKGIICEYDKTSTGKNKNFDTFKNLTFKISDDGENSNTFMAYQVNYLEKQQFESMDQIALGDTVVICGKIVNYNGNTPETTGQGAAYVYSHEKVTDTLEKFLEDWNATIRNSEKGLCDFLSGANKATLEALIARYNALEDANKAELVDKAGVKISESITYAKNVWNNSQTTEGNYGNSGVVITSNNSYDKTSLIALFAILGIVTISGYYIIEKKKFSK